MNVIDYLTISMYVNNCPNCDSDLLGDGQGTLSVEDSTFERTCKCGFKFKYDIAEGVKPRQIKQRIDEALSEC